MCAIVGLLSLDGSPASKELVARMTDALRHRGPDGDGVMSRGSVALGHRRLAIIDPTGGQQPMTNEDGEVWVTFNGEIYNFRELASDLKSRGHVFRTQSDTEVIVHAWEQWGEDCVKYFRGMFAFAVVDWRSGKLFLARDHFGIKPLFYIQTDKAFAFASELAPLKMVPGFKADLDLAAMDQYLWLQYIPAPRSIFRQIQKLPPARCMTVNLDGRISSPREFWTVAFQPDEKRSEAETIEAVDAAVRDSIKAHLVSDVPFGAFLSGGVDSSLVVANMSRLLNRPVQTFSIGFEEKEFDETQYARFAADHCGAQSHIEIVKANALAILPKLVSHYGEPFGDSSAVPTFHVSQLARKHVPMVLSGDGADEMFAGYWSHGDWMESRANKPSAAPTLPEWLEFIQYNDTLRRQSLWRPEFRSRCPAPLEFFTKEWKRAENFSLAHKVQYLDLKTYLPFDILTKVDIASMIHGLEVRTPLVDLRVVELAATIPDRFNLARGANGRWERKKLLKRVAAKYFPPEFLNRPKMGFAMPVAQWFAPGGKVFADVIRRLLGNDSTVREFFEPAVIQQLLAQGACGPVWLLVFLEEWLRQNKTPANPASFTPPLNKNISEMSAEKTTKDGAPPNGRNIATSPAATTANSSPRRPRVLLIADVPKWIFERHARTLHLFLRDEFDFTLAYQGQKFDEKNFDLIYPLEFNLVDSAQICEPSKFVTSIRSHLSWQSLDFQALTQLLAQKFQRIHVVSQRLQNIFQGALPGVECFSHGVDTEFFKPATSADQSGTKLRLGWAGNRLSGSKKGFSEIIEPLGKLPGVELVFCGFNDRNLTLQQMREFYDSLDAYVCASDFEGNNNSLMEAAAMQRAIVTTDNGAVPEYLRHGESALVVPRALPDFIDAVTKLRDDPALRVRLGTEAREAVKSKFDWRVMAGRYSDFFWRALEKSGRFQRPNEFAVMDGKSGQRERKPAAVSVVIPCYNQARFLGEAVESIVAQTFTDWEIIIVNDGSADATNETARTLISRYSDHDIRLVEQANRGLAGARNTGIRNARGRFILPLDADDKIHPEFLETTTKLLNSDTGTSIAYTDWKNFEESDREVAAADYDFNLLCSGRNLFICTSLFRRAVWDAVGGYNENMRQGYEDWDFWISCGQKGFFGRRIARPLFFYRIRAGSMVTSSAKFDRELRARIVLNHPALYKKSCVNQARLALGKETVPPAEIEGEAEGVFGMCWLSDELPDRSNFDEAYYLKSNSDVAAAVQKGQLASAWEHFIVNGKAERRPWAPLTAMVKVAKNAQTSDCPVVSIVIPVFNKLELTQRCLQSIAKNTDEIAYEIILVDNGSTDGTALFLRGLEQEKGSRVRALVNSSNLGFAKASNQGARAARGKYILFLNNDTEVLPGWLSPLVGILERDPSVAAVGSKLLFPDGTLQHAGVVVSSHEGVERIGPFHIFYKEKSNFPGANRATEYQVCTGACLLTRAEQISELGGFDEIFWNGFEDVDLCFRLRERGWRVVYEPQSVLIHYESQSGPERFSKEERNVEYLQQKWGKKITPDVLITADKKAIVQPGCCIKPYKSPAKSGDKKQTIAPRLQPPVKQSATTLRVTVVIPVFNNLQLTRQCLLSLQKNTPAGHCEVCVVDNASTDGTAEFLKSEEKAGRLRAIVNRENAGFARACNQGGHAANTELLLFLNNDTQVTPGWLGALCSAMGRPQVGIVGAKLLYANGTIQHAGIEFIGDVPDHPHRHFAADAPEVNQFRELDMVTGACLMISRELFLRLAGFDEIYRNGVEDVDLCLRARAAGLKVVYEPKAVVYHLEGQSVGRFNHVTENLNIFFGRWGKSFDAGKKFIAPKPAQFIASERSLFVAEKRSQNNKPVAVAWEGTFLDFGSLSYVNRQLTKCLAGQSEVELSLVGDRSLTASAKNCEELRRMASKLKTVSDTKTQVTVRHQWPPNWSGAKNGRLVIIQPWEFGALPMDWVKASANVDEFWVPSNYVRRVYIDSGIQPEKVVLVPNGIDPAEFKPGVAPLPIATKKKFRFLFVGGTIPRKGPDVLLQAYLSAFTAADDVCLVIKDFGGQSVYKGQTFEKEIAAAQRRPNAPEILYLNSEMPPGDLPRLYAACHCLVHPYRGEGFGLPVLEAMACGLPVVVSRGGATDDFVREDFGWFISAARKSIGGNVGGFPLAGEGWLLEPNVNDLVAKLKSIAANPEAARARGHAASEYVWRDWTWEQSARIAVERLQSIASRKKVSTASTAAPSPKPRAIELPDCAKVGVLNAARESLTKKDCLVAWESILAAIRARPFHPEAYLVLGQIAQSAGDHAMAKRCGEFAVQLAPNSKPARKFIGSIPSKAGQSRGFNFPIVADGKPRLSVCLIAKNEEQFIEGCLQSVREIAWQIVVVDTGSTDKTVEIAKKFDAEIHSFAWNDDFSAARNECLKHATGDWVLILDADEELVPEDRQTALKEMESIETIGYRLPIINQGADEEGCAYVPRLFRNAPGLFFVGRIHEQIFSSLLVRANEWGMKSRLSGARLLHHGYQAQVVASRDKNARNLRLLRMAIEEMPDEPNLVMNLGLELIRSGQFDAGLQQYLEAVRLMMSVPASQVVPELRETLLTQFTNHLLRAQRFSDIVEFWKKPFCQATPLTASQHFLLGLACLELKDHSPAAEHMRQCLAKRNQPALSPVNKEILKAGPRHCLALAFAAGGQTADAEKAFKAAIEEDSKSRPARFDFARLYFQTGRPVEALKLLNELAAESGKDIGVWLLGGQIALSQPDFLNFAAPWIAQACKNFPKNRELQLQLGELLLLTQKVEAALSLWKVASAPNVATHLAALILCEVLTGNCHRESPTVNEQLVSQEFLKWYRRLIKFNARETVNQINEELENFRAVLPSAARTLDAAVKKAGTVLAV